MRNKGGMMGVVGLMAIVAFFVLATMFVPKMFMAIDVNATASVNNTQFAAPYAGMVNLTQYVYSGYTVVPVLAGILVVMVALIWLGGLTRK